ncbi:MAG: holo-ACP synthase [Candidatus Delongbacteria bacterium]
MIYGIGTDIIEVERVKKSISRISGFKEKIFSAAEIEYCESKRNKYENYAGRFAAKEAFLKALGTGWRNGIGFNEISIRNNELGKPYIKLSGRALEYTSEIGISEFHVSVSHTKSNATAFVVLEK